MVLWPSGLLLTTVCLTSQPAELPAAVRPWSEYRTIMWVGDSARENPEKIALFLQRLREMGVNTAMVYGDGDPQPLLDHQFPYYVENLVNRGLCLKFNSNVRDWDKFVTDWARTGRLESGMIRDYCLDDPVWLDSARRAVTGIVGKNGPHQPLAYNLRDELSTTISANPFDYDFNPVALEGFRTWLEAQYVDLAALNKEWETRFGSWAEVRPFTTDQIKGRMATGESRPEDQPDWTQVQRLRFEPGTAQGDPTRWNFSPWADFRTYMDVSLARTLAELCAAAHKIDPSTPAGIEGTQMPDAFGGYDLWRLSRVLDWVEPYDIGSAREIFGSFMQGKPVLTTVFETETKKARRRLWHLLLEGDRGCLVWWSEDCINWKSPGLALTPKALALAPALREMTSPLAQAFLRAKREYDPIFIHYSQPSIQADWLIESTVDGSTWVRRFSSFEAEHNQMARTRTAWLKGLQDLGYSPRFLASAELEVGALKAISNVVLVLPNSWALSQKECDAIATVLDHSQRTDGSDAVLIEGPAGVFDEHGKLRPGNQSKGFLATAAANIGCSGLDAKGQVARTGAESRAYLTDRLSGEVQSAWLGWLESVLRQRRPAVLIPQTAHVRVHRFRVKAGRLIAIERNIDYQMSEELKQAGGNQALETPVFIEAILPEASHVYNLRSETYLGHTDRIRFTLDPWQPSLFALMREKVSPQSLANRLASE